MNRYEKFLYFYLLLFISFYPISAKKHERSKRDLGSVISIISIVAEVGPPIYDIIRQSLKKKRCGKKISADMVNQHYNNDMANSQQLKSAVSTRMPEAGAAIHMNASGYRCDDLYCTEMGSDMRGTLGICARQYCACNNGIGTLLECPRGKVFDPKTDSCKPTSQAILCH